MSTITPHTTRAEGTILTAAIYNADHVNHVTNSQSLNTDKMEGATPPVVDGHAVLWDGTSAAALKTAGFAPANVARQIATGAGLLGGGTLAADRTLTPDFADQATAEAGASAVKVMSPLRTKQLLDANGAFPIGFVADYAGNAAPAKWLLCYGQAVSRTTYAALFAVLSTTYGAGDGTTTFNVPDLRGRVVAGKDDMGGAAASRLTNSGTGNPGVNGASLGASGGVDRHTLTTAQMPAHTHASLVSVGSFTSGAEGPGTTSGNTGSTGGGEAHPNVQPTLVLNKMIFAGV